VDLELTQLKEFIAGRDGGGGGGGGVTRYGSSSESSRMALGAIGVIKWHIQDHELKAYRDILMTVCRIIDHNYSSALSMLEMAPLRKKAKVDVVV
jgi:hypothetical protein